RPMGLDPTSGGTRGGKPQGPSNMNIAQRDAARAAKIANKSATETAAPEPAAVATAEVAPASEAARGRKLKPLLSLVPYVLRYRWQALAALIALLVAALATLVVPIAVRRMIDFGFSRDSATMIDSYFTVMIGLVGVLALASAARFYLVTTLGERIVADLREAG